MKTFLKQYAVQMATIILDIKCLKEPNQEIEHEDFLFAALSFLDQNYPDIPRAVLTADSDKHATTKKWFKKEEVFQGQQPKGWRENPAELKVSFASRHKYENKDGQDN